MNKDCHVTYKLIFHNFKYNREPCSGLVIVVEIFPTMVGWINMDLNGHYKHSDKFTYQLFNGFIN